MVSTECMVRARNLCEVVGPHADMCVLPLTDLSRCPPRSTCRIRSHTWFLERAGGILRHSTYFTFIWHDQSHSMADHQGTESINECISFFHLRATAVTTPNHYCAQCPKHPSTLSLNHSNPKAKPQKPSPRKTINTSPS